MKAYADDCTLQIQVKGDSGWLNCGYSPNFLRDCEYRIKPEEVKMIRVGRHEWQEPLKEVPDEGGVWTFSFEYDNVIFVSPCYKIEAAIAEGVAHRTKEAAEQHRQAMRCINRGDIE